jgi:FixJ family two-component response regulator
MTIRSGICVVDDDASMRQALVGLLKSAGFHPEAFASAEEFLESGRLADTGCLVLDVRMGKMTGLELQEQLIASGSIIPIILITAHCSEDSRMRALDLGALDFLQKPFSDKALLEAIAKAVGTPGCCAGLTR